MLSLVLTLLGDDRPGLIGSVAALVKQHGGNWIESRMAHLAGQFAGIVRVSVREDQADALMAALEALSRQGLRVSVQKDSVTSLPVRDSHTVDLDLLGSDRPGIVSEVTQVLASRGVNVEEFQTECVEAPMSGEILFRAKARLHLPNRVTLVQLQTDLERIALDLMVDIKLVQAE